MEENFLWGAATSSHQVEGNNVSNDWWDWERSRPEIANSGRAADHWRLWRDDFSLAKQLGHNAYRLSLEWSRIEPERGNWNKQALEHYQEVLTGLKERGLASFVTLHHFTSPLWLAKRGGWTNKETPELFGNYVDVVVQHLGDLVDFWVTINEPLVYASQSYWHRRWPPQQRSIRQTWRVVRHMAEAHRRSYRLIHRYYPQARVGTAKNMIAYLDGSWLSDWWFNRYWFKLTKGTYDYIGVNYYFTKQRGKWRGAVSDMGWPLRPEGLTHVLREVGRYKKPIYITENGLADAADSRRADFIRQHVKAMQVAQREGVDVRGYLHWSLLDNYEWDSGFEPRFGLIEVDYKTMKRKIRSSAYVLKAFIDQDVL